MTFCYSNIRDDIGNYVGRQFHNYLTEVPNTVSYWTGLVEVSSDDPSQIYYIEIILQK